MLSPKDLGSAESFLALVFGSSSYSRFLRQAISRFAAAATGGAIAGEVFLHLLQLKLHRPDEASVGKAAFLVSRDLEDKQLHSGKAAPSNADRVHTFWAKFRPAAHFWAAFRLAQDAGQAQLASNFSESEFAAVNDHILLGADLLLSRAMGAQLDFDPRPWKLPDAYPRKPFYIGVPPPTPWAIERLREYRAPRRS